jgi:peptidoglycan hydrolase-like protein with peptidoglycan-binding domain
MKRHHSPAIRRSWTKRAIGSLLGVAAIGGAAIGTRAALDHLRSDEPTVVAESDTKVSAAEVRDLTESFTATGTLQYDESVDVAAPVAGTILSIVDTGTTLRNGDVIATIDDQVVVWLDGDVPAWREMSQGDEGVDVLQLETALAALGFNADNDVTVDEEYTSATASMVKDWQSSLGVEATGRVGLGTVIFGGARTRVASTAAGIGDSITDGAALVALGSTDHYAVLEAAPAEAVTLRVGDPAAVQLPDRTDIEGSIVSITSGSDTWQITVAFDSTVEFPATDVSNVEMSWDHDVVDGVLTVPSSALLRLDSGGYVVDVVNDDGSLTPTPVTIGAAVGTRIEIVDGIVEGTRVISL